MSNGSYAICGESRRQTKKSSRLNLLVIEKATVLFQCTYRNNLLRRKRKEPFFQDFDCLQLQKLINLLEVLTDSSVTSGRDFVL